MRHIILACPYAVLQSYIQYLIQNCVGLFFLFFIRCFLSPSSFLSQHKTPPMSKTPSSTLIKLVKHHHHRMGTSTSTSTGVKYMTMVPCSSSTNFFFFGDVSNVCGESNRVQVLASKQQPDGGRKLITKWDNSSKDDDDNERDNSGTS